MAKKYIPEYYLIYSAKFVGAFVVLININVQLTLWGDGEQFCD